MSASHFLPFRLFGCALLAAALPAQSAEAMLRLSEALARAAERNPSLAPHASAERAAEALIEQAGLRPNPTLEFEAENFAGTGTRQGVRSLETTVRANQTIERGSKREKRVAVAARDRDLAAADHAVKRAEVLSATAVAFVEALAVQQRVAFTAEPVALAREIVDAADARVKAGVAFPADLARARAALAVAQAEQARAQTELAAAHARLAALWGGAPGDVPRLHGTLQLPSTLPSERTLIDRLALHPRLARQHAIIASRRAALDLERTQATADIAIGGGVRFLREGSDAALVAGVSVPLPNRQRNQGSIRAARENLTGAEQTLHAVEAELRSEFAAAWQGAITAHAVAQSLRHEALPALQEANALVRRAYAEGQLPLGDVLDAQRDLVALRRELLELDAKFAAAHARAEALADPNLPATSALLSLP